MNHIADGLFVPPPWLSSTAWLPGPGVAMPIPHLPKSPSPSRTQGKSFAQGRSVHVSTHITSGYFCPFATSLRTLSTAFVSLPKVARPSS